MVFLFKVCFSPQALFLLNMGPVDSLPRETHVSRWRAEPNAAESGLYEIHSATTRPVGGVLLQTLVSKDDENLDPKTWSRFPILSGGIEVELAELRSLISQE